MASKYIGSSFDRFLEEESLLDEVRNCAAKKILSMELHEFMKKEKLTKTALAKKLDTSRSAIERLLDPSNESVTLITLKKAALVMGKRIKLELVPMDSN